jgi:hypothetical protein
MLFFISTNPLEKFRASIESPFLSSKSSLNFISQSSLQNVFKDLLSEVSLSAFT